ncbi:phage holin family protein [Terrabacter aerolatus]|uniref:Transporter n=1 Tax=Terrabacter aerolatus TaxID=422442 RepID=A0A512D6K3_9MICO|nr:phage holin family protein [Terrabacter aerolatus]GEO31880.1 transporter [Terrabacter aerolatus]
MSTDPRQERTLGQLVASATQDLSTLVRSEIALAKAEVSVQVKKAGVGGGLLAGAAVIGFYSVYFIFTTIAEGIQALGLPRWLSFLIVTVFMLLVAGVLALLGIRKMKTVKPTPEKAITEAQTTVAALKSATEHPGATVPAPRPEWDRKDLPASSTVAASSSAGTAASTPNPSRDA